MAHPERPTWLVARREIKEATRAKAFRVTLIISALALAAIIVIANIGKNNSATQDVVVAGPDAAERATGIERLGQATGLRLAVSTATDDAAATARVDDGSADVAVSADGAQLTTRKPVNLDGGSKLATVVNVLRANLAIDNGLRAAGLTPEQAAAVRDTPPPQVASVHAADEDSVDTRRVGTVTVTNILLFILLQTYGQWVLNGVTREKASRVVEVLLAMISPRQLLVGKVVGIGLVAISHAAVLVTVALITTRVVGVDLTSGLSAGNLLLAAAWFVLGYALYCGAYAAAGSLVSRVEDAQSVAFPIMLPLLFGYLASFSAVTGASTLLWVLAFFPPTAVMAMPALYAVGAADAWMVVVSMALTAVSVVLVGMLAVKVYERSVMRTGRKVSWREAFRTRAEIDRPAPVAGTAAPR